MSGFVSWSYLITYFASSDIRLIDLTMVAHEEIPLALRTFCIAELARLICNQVGRHDQTTLMRVCSQFHLNVAPSVWENHISLSNLFGLISVIETIPLKSMSSHSKVCCKKSSVNGY